MPLRSILDFAHTAVADALRPGGVAMDATVGNGHDTLFLAQTLGPGGTVYGFDVQAEALQRARMRLATASEAAFVQWIHAGHETLRQHLADAHTGQVDAVMFNLGYLPGSDKTRITRPATTVPALDQALEVLRPGGLVSVVLYRGHPGGFEEAEAVEAWAVGCEQDAVRVLKYHFINQQNQPPRLLLLEKQGG